MTKNSIIITSSLVLLGLVSQIANGYFADDGKALPIPLMRQIGGNTTRAISVNEFSHQITEDERCTDECKATISDAFKAFLLQPTMAQKGLAPWRLSLHPEFDMAPQKRATPGTTKLDGVIVNFVDPKVVDLMPPLGTWTLDTESYSLYVSAEAKETKVVLNATTVWGVLRAFPTMAQIARWTDETYTAELTLEGLPLLINDKPRFRWRGLMIDTARHFVSIDKLKKIVDTLAWMKMNVLHLHLSDAQSFSFEISGVSGFEKSVFSQSRAMHRKAAMKQFIEYARSRGVMVVPEVDMPGHCASWRHAADGDVATDCWAYLQTKHGAYLDNLVPLNPAGAETWNTIETVLGEIAETFTHTPYIHVGGDEVNKDCWLKSEQYTAIQQWMAAKGITSLAGVEAYFDLFVQKTVGAQSKAQYLRPIVWDESLSMGNLHSSDTVIQVWHSQELFVQSLQLGHDTIMSYGYYLDRQSPLCSTGCTPNWMFSRLYRDFYATDLEEGLNLTKEEKEHILGGEAALWGESQDEISLDQMAFARTFAIAERLWSDKDVASDPDDLERRAQRLRCLMVRVGVTHTGPLSSDYCELAH